MHPWGAAIFDALESSCSRHVIETVVSQPHRGPPLTHIRARTLVGTWVMLDESQQYEKPALIMALTRLGNGSRVVLTHDLGERDNLRVGRHEGIASVINSLTGNPLFADVRFSRSERSPIAAPVASCWTCPSSDDNLTQRAPPPPLRGKAPRPQCARFPATTRLWERLDLGWMLSRGRRTCNPLRATRR